jgi:hypothetical protein
MDLWAIIGRLAVIATVLTAFFKFISWWRAPKEKLVARVLPNAFVLPPTIETEFSAAADKVQQAIDEFLKRYPKEEDGYDKAYSRADMLAFDVRHAVPRQLSFENKQFAGCWHARLDNNGKRKCSGVSLHLPNAVLARVQRDSDREPVVAPVKGLVSIGELRPRGHCFVTAWTTSQVESRDNYDVVLTHDSGVGKVLGQWQTNRLGWIIGTLIQRENLLSLFVPLVFAIVGITIVGLGLGSMLSKPGVKPSGSMSATPIPTPSSTPNLPR